MEQFLSSVGALWTCLLSRIIWASINFSLNTPQEISLNITQITGVKATGTFEKYLGLPTILGRKIAKALHSLLDKVGGKISIWKKKILSAASKEILFKSVLQAFPSYIMGIFLLPKSILKDLMDFWRNSGGSVMENQVKSTS